MNTANDGSETMTSETDSCSHRVRQSVLSLHIQQLFLNNGILLQSPL